MQVCGRDITEVVRELYPGAASEWARRMNGGDDCDEYTGRPPALEQTGFQAPAPIRIYAHPPEVYNTPLYGELPLASTSGATYPVLVSTTNDGVREYVLLCVKQCNFKTILVHDDTSRIRGDEDMFQSISDEYYSRKRRWARWFGLRSLQTVEFVRVGIRFPTLSSLFRGQSLTNQTSSSCFTRGSTWTYAMST